MFLRQNKTTYILGVCCFTRMQVMLIWVIKSFICALNKYLSATNQISGSQWLIFRVVSKIFEVMDSNFKITKLTLHFQRTPRMQVFNFWHSTYKVQLKNDYLTAVSIFKGIWIENRKLKTYQIVKNQDLANMWLKITRKTKQ